MPIPITWPARQGSQLHQKNWGASFAWRWRRWLLRRARHSRRGVIGELPGNPHLLADIGTTPEQALKAADRPFWDVTNLYIHSL